MRSVLVIGGGPAGCAAAVTLARLGHAVTLLEKERGPLHKVCGEFLSTEALCYFEQLGVDVDALGAVQLQRVRLQRSGSAAETTLPFAAKSLSRCRLDQALLELAGNSGVQVRTGAAVAGLAATHRGITAALRGGEEWRADHAILATGKHDLPGLPRGEGSHRGLVGWKMYWRLADAQLDALGDAVELFPLPGGYAGLQRVEDGYANLCALLPREDLRRLGAKLEGVRGWLCANNARLGERLRGAGPAFSRPLAVHPVPYGFLRQSAVAGNIWAAGDQAAVIPSFSGDGISIALHSGMQAAAMLSEGLGAEEFQRRLAGSLASQVRFATLVSKMLVRPRVARTLEAAATFWPGGMVWAADRTRIPESVRFTRAS